MIFKIKTLGKVLRTVSHLKPIQVAYQLKNRFNRPSALKDYAIAFNPPKKRLRFSDLPAVKEVSKVEGQRYQFTFLNLTTSFNNEVDWNDEEFGKLWNYNLQYLDFLRQEDIGEDIKTYLLHDLYGWLETGKLRLEPYPVSLRIMNVIRFLSQQERPDPQLQQWLQAEVNYLSQNLEYHLLGNHLLENGFALLMGGHYFDYPQWIKVAENLLRSETQEQILEDGAHFELSPMYHQIILFRLLEAIDYLPKDNPISAFLQERAGKMFAWLKTMTFRSGNIPHFNDSADGIAFSTDQLLKMAARSGIVSTAEGALATSGYRKLQNSRIELIADVHGISPSYQPGHAHADSLSFVMEAYDKPFVVDMGISTYQISPTRDYERSTKAHNAVTINDQDTAEVWSGFRVGRRPKVTLSKADDSEIHAQINYRGFIHKRTFVLTEQALSVLDQVNGSSEAIARLYFHPDVQVISITVDKVVFSNKVSIQVEGSLSLKIFNYLYNKGYNLQTPGQFLEISFKVQCRIQFSLQE